MLLYNGSNWINSDTIPDNLLFIKDDLDGTKKMQFQLSNITAGNTRILTVPDASTTIVGTDVVQTLTNKTLTDSTNNIMAKSLKSATTTTIDVSAATAPSTGQILTATSSNTANWQTLSSTTCSGLSSATTIVNINASAAPSSGQVLTATNSTSASWKTLS